MICLLWRQALLRKSVSADRRLAMKALRRLPRVHGITVSFSAAVLVIDLMKRALVFMALVSCLLCSGHSPFLVFQYDRAIGPVLGSA